MERSLALRTYGAYLQAACPLDSQGHRIRLSDIVMALCLEAIPLL